MNIGCKNDSVSQYLKVKKGKPFRLFLQIFVSVLSQKFLIQEVSSDSTVLGKYQRLR